MQHRRLDERFQAAVQLSYHEPGVTIAPSSLTFPNQPIKVHVQFGRRATPWPRTLVLGLFRSSLKDQTRPIFLRSLHLQQSGAAFSRVQVRAPKTIGEFDFRVFDELEPDVLLLPTASLHVQVDLPYWEESSTTLEAKLDTNDVSTIVTAILSYGRVLEAVPTVYTNHGARLSALMHRLLDLRWEEDQEALHGALRSFLHTVEANRHVWGILEPATQHSIITAQHDEYCGVFDRYFESFEAKQSFWAMHFNGVQPLPESSIEWSNLFLTLWNAWIDEKSRQLMPNLSEFAATRQAIYERVRGVVEQLPVPNLALDVFGSSNNFFGSMSSDMDMCLVVQPPVESSSEKQKLLQMLVTQLPSDLFDELDTARLTARIPIVMFRDFQSSISCDVCVENTLALRNTRLLRTYALTDPRVRILAYVLKNWVKQRKINNAADGTLSSYGYILMLLHYLQRTEPPVLPVLQTLPPTWQGEIVCPCLRISGGGKNGCDHPACALMERRASSRLPSVVFQNRETYFFDPVQDIQWTWLQQFGAQNTQSVAELWLGFFRYFDAFDYATQVVSIRMGRPLRKVEKSEWKYHARLMIEDPFELDYDVAHVVKGAKFKLMRQEFAKMYWTLVQANNEGNSDMEDLSARLFAPREDEYEHDHDREEEKQTNN
ncbi:hypothetical protein Ae201684P_015972 [Aphanomyces euteiches]|uniref:Uncharacterized protein n=1 Tax=Aphanomyces euteiches TaxID=100861 RepID=A0A6G0W7P0_9STRA|nr:hypothetical protein Ae201684_018138 [Aphanomyces euteiches]KAH9074074.1 hypothetical protein Ae201684P_015972 [Aphanomyces euteiches]KAH9151663.1 hypothetical protein AeRB84_005765 [Aphanomyces euteiches]